MVKYLLGVVRRWEMLAVKARYDGKKVVLPKSARNAPPGKVIVVFEESEASDEATAEILKIPGLLEDLAEARKDRAAGRFIPWEKLKRKYKKKAGHV